MTTFLERFPHMYVILCSYVYIYIYTPKIPVIYVYHVKIIHSFGQTLARWVTLLNLSGEAPLCEYTTVIALGPDTALTLGSWGGGPGMGMGWRPEAGKFISALMGAMVALLA